MTRRRKILGGLALALATGGVFLQHDFVARHRRALDARRAELVRLETAIREERARLAASERSALDAETELDARRERLAAEEAGSIIKLWAHRTALLKRMLVELPGEAIPELKLLEPADWARVVRPRELDSTENIRTALATLRALARRKFGEQLQEALKRFTEASGGDLPGNILELARFLPPPADAEMLARYALTRAGKIAATDEVLIRERPIGDMILSVALASLSVNLNGDWTPSDGADAIVAATRGAAAIQTAFDLPATDDTGEAALVNSIGGFRDLVERTGPLVESALGETFGENFGAELKSAVRAYQAAHNGTPPTHFGELLPHLSTQHQGAIQRLAPLARTFFAEIEYLRDHDGRAPADRALLQPYLDKPFDLATALRAVRLTVEGDKVTATFNWSAR